MKDKDKYTGTTPATPITSAPDAKTVEMKPATATADNANEVDADENPAAVAITHVAGIDMGMGMDPKIEAIIPWTLEGFRLEESPRTYTGKENKTLKLATALVRLKGSTEPWFTPVSITYVQPLNGGQPYVKAGFPATQQKGGAYAVGAIQADSAAAKAAFADWKNKLLSGPFARWAKTQDLAGLLRKGQQAIDMGVSIPGLALSL